MMTLPESALHSTNPVAGSSAWAALAGILLLVLTLSIAPPVSGQALPAGEAAPISTGFSVPRAAGTLNYAISASETVTWGYYGNQGSFAATNLSGDLGFLSGSKVYPFSVVFSGGHSWATSGQSSYSYLNLDMSQVANWKRWSLVLSDNVGYLPATPTTGLSGIPGVGDLGVNPVQLGISSGQGVLTQLSDRVSNTAMGSLERQLTGRTSLNGFGSYTTFRFLDSGSKGLDDNSVSGGGGFTHQIDARNSIGGNYVYSNFDYPFNGVTLYEPSYSSQIASGQYTHHFTPKLSMTASAGPEWTKLGTPGSSQTLSLYANASVSYQAKSSTVNAYYWHSTNSGFGVIPGALTQGGGIGFNRLIARVWNFSASGSYTESYGLPANQLQTSAYNFDTTVAGVQASRAIVKSVSIYASYTFEHQTSGGGSTADVFSGREQVIGFGVTYAPASIHTGRQ